VNGRRLVFRSLLHHQRTHLGAFGAAALAAAVIVAALSVGDSVDVSLERVADARLGRVGYAVHARDRLWREPLRFSLAMALDATVSGSLQLNGSLALEDGSARVSRARVLGVDSFFWALSPRARSPLQSWPADGIAVSEHVAARMGVGIGDTLLIRVERPSLVPREAPLRSDRDAIALLSGTVAAILGPGDFGRFALEIGPLPPANVFVPLARLQHAVDEPGRINALMVERGTGDESTIDAATRGAWSLGDAGLELRPVDGDRGWQLTSRRVFLDPKTVEAASRVEGTRTFLTWLVNDLAVGGRRTPYSMVAAIPPGTGIFGPEIRDGEIVVNRWLAEDLEAGAGDCLTLRYFVPVDGGRLEERASDLVIRSVVPLEGAAADPDLMPAFPGLTENENCRDWDPGFALDLDRIRDKDEAYWDAHRGTPKAFVSEAMGRRLWANPYGTATAVRFPAKLTRDGIEATLLSGLDPANFGLRFTNVADAGAAARASGTDFGALFLGFSGLLVIAALLLAGLVVALNVEMRRTEIATLLALGFTTGRVRRLFAIEHALVALAGGIAGAVVGPALAAAALSALDTVWSDVAGSLEIALVVRQGTLIAGALAGAVAATAAAYLVLRVAIRPSIREVFVRQEQLAVRLARTRAGRCVGAWVGLVFAIAAVVLAFVSGTGRDPATAGAFFTSGSLLLCAGLSFVWYALAHVGVVRKGKRLTARGLAWRNLGRRRARSLAVVGVVAFGVFMFLGPTVFRRDRLTTADDRASGTGGFALVGECSTAVVHDLDSDEGRTFHALTGFDLEDVRVVGLRAREGDDASCRSLSRAQAPPVLGVDPAALSGRFTFVQGGDGEGWSILDDDSVDGALPAVIDQATFWTLGTALGDVVFVPDEAGRDLPFYIAGVIDNSILHGHLVISASVFRAHFPSDGGYRRFLIDAPPSRTDEVAAILTRQLEDRGLALERTETRLNAYNAVENTYLGIFQALGGLGLLLGSIGLGLVVARNTAERRPELALLQALGLSRRRVERLVLAENSALLAAGLVTGLAAALLSIVPALVTPGARVATPLMGFALLALIGGGVGATLVATRRALSRGSRDDLREE
jgi:putative ABC transport system permease protein